MPMMNRKATLPDKQAIYQTNTPDRQANYLPDKHCQTDKQPIYQKITPDRQANNLLDKHCQIDKQPIYQTNSARQTSKQSTRQTLLDRQANNLPDKHQTDKQPIYQKILTAEHIMKCIVFLKHVFSASFVCPPQELCYFCIRPWTDKQTTYQTNTYFDRQTHTDRNRQNQENLNV